MVIARVVMLFGLVLLGGMGLLWLLDLASIAVSRTETIPFVLAVLAALGYLLRRPH